MELSHERLTALRSVTKLSSHELSFNTLKTISPLYRPAMSSQLLVHKTLKLLTKHQNAYREQPFNYPPAVQNEDIQPAGGAPRPPAPQPEETSTRPAR